jgi:hypothetical protein
MLKAFLFVALFCLAGDALAFHGQYRVEMMRNVSAVAHNVGDMHWSWL